MLGSTAKFKILFRNFCFSTAWCFFRLKKRKQITVVIQNQHFVHCPALLKGKQNTYFMFFSLQHLKEYNNIHPLSKDLIQVKWLFSPTLYEHAKGWLAHRDVYIFFCLSDGFSSCFGTATTTQFIPKGADVPSASHSLSITPAFIREI